MKYMVWVLIFCVGCSPTLPNAAEIAPITAIPTQDNVTLCILGQDASASWTTRLEALQTVHERQGQCDTNIDLLLYLAYVQFGDFMAAAGDATIAQTAYEQALFYVPDGDIAQTRLATLTQAEVTEAVPTCDNGTTSDLAAYTPRENAFAILRQDTFRIDDARYVIYGVNYYPRDTPFARFLVETDLELVETEFGLMQDAGLNTLRIFLHPQQLFLCDAAVPNPATFEVLDNLIALAHAYELRLLMVLHEGIPANILYSAPDYLRAQLAFIVERYRDEPTIVAWDVRDSGDADIDGETVGRDAALQWLAETVIFIRGIDPRHPVTAGWQADSLVTAPLVDFVSFQSYGNQEDLQRDIADLRAGANRPILLSAVGYSTFNVSEVVQRNFLFQTFEAIENNNLMGWMVFQAFDYPRSVTCIAPDCPSPAQPLNQYGIWNTGYFPKLALEAIHIRTGVEE